jgi:O-antigen/teichoic acid export membrane protein
VWALISDLRLRWTLVFSAFFLIANNFFLFGVLLNIAFGQNIRYAALMLIKSITALTLGALLGLAFGLPGALAGELTSVVALAAYLGIPRPFLPGLRLGSWRVIKDFLGTGLPLLGSALSQNLGRNIDRLIILPALGIAAFGQYTFAMILALGGNIVVAIVSQYITPKICFRVGAGGDPEVVRREIDRLVLLVVAVALLLYVPFYFLADTTAQWIAPSFAVGIGLMKIVYWGALFQIAQLYQAILVATGKVWMLFRQAAIVTAVSAALCLCAMLFGLSAEAFACVFAFSRALSGLMLWRLASSQGVTRSEG